MAEDDGQLWDQLRFNRVMIIVCSTLIVFLSTFYFMTRSRKIYLLDFACYNAQPESMCNREECVKKLVLPECFTPENLAFQKKILERSELGEKTYFPQAFMSIPLNPCMVAVRKEAEIVMIGAIDDLLSQTGVKAKDIGILVVNCSLFNPMLSLSSMVVNHYKLRKNIMSYNLGGMGCNARLISIDLAK